MATLPGSKGPMTLVFVNYEIAHGIVHSAKSLHEIMNVTLMSGRDSSGGAALRCPAVPRAAPRWRALPRALPRSGACGAPRWRAVPRGSLIFSFRMASCVEGVLVYPLVTYF